MSPQFVFAYWVPGSPPESLSRRASRRHSCRCLRPPKRSFYCCRTSSIVPLSSLSFPSMPKELQLLRKGQFESQENGHFFVFNIYLLKCLEKSRMNMNDVSKVISLSNTELEWCTDDDDHTRMQCFLKCPIEIATPKPKLNHFVLILYVFWMNGWWSPYYRTKIMKRGGFCPCRTCTCTKN